MGVLSVFYFSTPGATAYFLAYVIWASLTPLYRTNRATAVMRSSSCTSQAVTMQSVMNANTTGPLVRSARAEDVPRAASRTAVPTKSTITSRPVGSRETCSSSGAGGVEGEGWKEGKRVRRPGEGGREAQGSSGRPEPKGRAVAATHRETLAGDGRHPLGAAAAAPLPLPAWRRPLQLLLLLLVGGVPPRRQLARGLPAPPQAGVQDGVTVKVVVPLPLLLPGRLLGAAAAVVGAGGRLRLLAPRQRRLGVCRGGQLPDRVQPAAGRAARG